MTARRGRKTPAGMLGNRSDCTAHPGPGDPILVPLGFAAVQIGAPAGRGRAIFCRGDRDDSEDGCIDLVLDLEASPDWRIVDVRYWRSTSDRWHLDFSGDADQSNELRGLTTSLPHQLASSYDSRSAQSSSMSMLEFALLTAQVPWVTGAVSDEPTRSVPPDSRWRDAAGCWDASTVPQRMHTGEIAIDEALVQRLLTAQRPELASLPLTLVEPWGTDNAIWRLGEDLVVRLPRIHWATEQVDLEATWLPRLGPQLPIATPEPLAVGEPGQGYPYRWAVHRWLPGVPASSERIADPGAFALDLAEVVQALWRCPTRDAPPPRGRARPLEDYDDATRRAIYGARHLIDTQAATAVWEHALSAPGHDGDAVWVHGDLEGNCLLEGGRLTGLVDWGSACTGDPAVDVQVIWSPLFTDEARSTFLDALDIDEATVARSRGAAINQACAALPYYLDTSPLIVQRSWHKLVALGVDPRHHPTDPTSAG